MSQEKQFYVYVHRYASGPKQGEVFYVGKGHGKRAWSKSRSNPHWHNIVNKYGYTIDVLSRFHNEQCAFSFERALISFYGRGNLCNLTDGGEGTSGFVQSEEAKKKMSGPRPNAHQWLLGKNMPDWLKEKLRDAKLGKPQSEKHAEKSRIAKLGFKVSDTSKFNVEKRKSVIRSDGVSFISVNDAARSMSLELGVNVSQGNISMALSGKRKTAYGFTWRFA